MKSYSIVYQCGLANVFRLDSAESRTRVLQGSYTECEAFSRGLVEAGATIHVAHCDRAGDIAEVPWIGGAGDLWTAEKHPPRK